MEHRRHVVTTALVWAGAAIFAAVQGSPGAHAGTPPPGFAEQVLVAPDAATGAILPTAVAWEPGTGSLWVLEKGDGNAESQARVRRMDPSTGAVTTALTLDCVDSRGERGLLGIAFSPRYLDPGGDGRYVYLYYTRRIAGSGPCSLAGQPQASRNRVSRLTESGGSLSVEEVVLDGPDLTSATNHNGGTLRFAPDGTLFVSVGDNNTDADANPRSRDLGDLRGKMLRIHEDGSAPADNPFVGQPGVLPQIWAWGLRNPFRFSVDPETGTPVIGDVGESIWEAVYVGVPGADYGYPCVEGVAPFRRCDPAPEPGTLTDPAFVYGHGNETPPVSGNSITGGPVYRADAFPEEYHGAYFFGDYVDGWIRRGRLTADARLVDVEMFIPDATQVVDMVVSPEGCLTWVSISAGVRDVCNVGGSNGQPRALASADPQSGLAPVQVSFTGSTSSDPDGDALSFAWDLGDGTFATEADPVHVYASDGVYDAVLTVDDGRQQANSTDAAPPVRVVVGNRAPVASVDLPVPGSTYEAGGTIAFAGSADDPEDGTLGAGALAWTVAFHHGGHVHPFLGPLTGIASGQFSVPTTGEDATDVFFRIQLRATDSGASLGDPARLDSTAFVDLVPDVTTITLDARPAGFGLELELDRTAGVAPVSLASVVGFPRTAGAPSPQTVGGRTFSFVSWSDSGAREHVVATPSSDTTLTAQFVCEVNCGGLDSDGDGFTAAQGDCDDGNAGVYPDAPEICDLADNDCDGGLDDAACSEFDATADGLVDGSELAGLGRGFGLCSANPAAEWWFELDLNTDGCVDGDDLAILASVWGCVGGGPACDG